MRSFYLRSSFLLLILFGAFFSAPIAFAIPPFTPYDPAQTLDPTCLPGSPNCFVQILPDQVGNNGLFLTTNGATTSWAAASSTVPYGTSTATNGLTFATATNVFTLGGTLNQTTSIDQAGLALTLFGGNSFFSTLFSSTTNASTTNTDNLLATNGTTTNSTSTNTFATTASSTNLFTTNFNLSTGTIANLMISGGTTTANNGFNLTSGCYAVAGVCVPTYSQFSTSTATNGLTFATATNVFTLGGTLNQTTSIDQAGFALTLFGGNSFFSTLFSSTTNATTSSSTNLFATNFNLATGTIANLMISGGTTTATNGGFNLTGGGCYSVAGICLTNSNTPFAWSLFGNSDATSTSFLGTLAGATAADLSIGAGGIEGIHIASTTGFVGVGTTSSSIYSLEQNGQLLLKYDVPATTRRQMIVSGSDIIAATGLGIGPIEGTGFVSQDTATPDVLAYFFASIANSVSVGFQDTATGEGSQLGMSLGSFSMANADAASNSSFINGSVSNVNVGSNNALTGNGSLAINGNDLVLSAQNVGATQSSGVNLTDTDFQVYILSSTKTLTVDSTTLSWDGDMAWSLFPSTRDDTATTTPTNFLYTDISGNLSSAPISAITNTPFAWSLYGNADATSTSQLGTTVAEDLQLISNGPIGGAIGAGGILIGNAQTAATAEVSMASNFTGGAQNIYLGDSNTGTGAQNISLGANTGGTVSQNIDIGADNYTANLTQIRLGTGRANGDRNIFVGGNFGGLFNDTISVGDNTSALNQLVTIGDTFTGTVQNLFFGTANTGLGSQQISVGSGYGGSANQQINIGDSFSGGGAQTITVGSASGINSLRLRAGTGDIINTATNGAITFNTGTIEYARFSSNQNLGLGTTTPRARLSIAGAPGTTTPLLLISSSTAGFATATILAINSNGALNYTGFATSTWNNGHNLTSGCYAITGICLQNTNTLFAWSLYGNADATTTSAIGTTNAFALKFITNNVERMSIATTTGNVGIGISNPDNALHIASTTGFISGLRLGITDATVATTSNGKALTVDANGDVILTDLFGGCVPTGSGINNECSGTNALQALTTGFNNSAFGDHAMEAMTAGDTNVAFGTNALASSSLGVWNTAVGNDTLRLLTAGDNNSAFGTNALSLFTLGDSNTGIGNNAFSQLTTGVNNTSIGGGAGGSQLSGSNNIAIGASQGLFGTTSSNQLNIGGAIFGVGLSGNENAPAGFIGIGTTTPTESLSVIGNGLFSGKIAVGGADGSTINPARYVNIDATSTPGVLTEGTHVGITITDNSTVIGTRNLLKNIGTGGATSMVGNFNTVRNVGDNNAGILAGTLEQVENSGAGTATFFAGDWKNIDNLGTGNIGTMMGQFSDVNNTGDGDINLLFGTRNLLNHAGIGTVGDFIGSSQNLTSAGLVDNAWSSYSTFDNDGTVNNEAVLFKGIFTNSAAGAAPIVTGLDISGWSDASGGGVSDVRGIYIDDSISFGAGTNYALAIDSTADSYFMGGVGIGTAFPGAQLNILTPATNIEAIRLEDGIDTVGQFIVDSDPNGVLAGARGSIAQDYTNGVVYVNTDDAMAWSALGGGASCPPDSTSVVCDGGNTLGATMTVGTNDNQDLSLEVNNATQLTIDSATGNVGINTASPNERLEVNGNFRMPSTNALATQGVYYYDGVRWMHNRGGNSTFVGALAGNFANTGSDNVGLGTFGLSNVTSGSRNTAVGSSAGVTISSAGDNTYFGYSAGAGTSVGSRNVAMGSEALFTNSTGSSSVAIGARALFGATGDANIAIGHGAGSTTVAGTGNLLIGRSVLASAAGASNEMNIAGFLFGTGINSLTGNFGVGTTSPAGTLGIAGTLFVGTTTATSTFAGDLNVQGLLKVGTSSITLVGNATSTFTGGGINLTNGCYAVGGGCLNNGNVTASSSASSTAGSGVAFWADGTNLTASSSAFYWNNTLGRLGINTAAPNLSLHVLSRDITDVMVVENTNANGFAGIQYLNDAGNVFYTGLAGSANITNPNSWYVTRDGSAGRTLLLDSTGNVGIGILAPTAKLHVVGDIVASTTATSTFQGGGINLTTAAGNTGCYAINGTCLSTLTSGMLPFSGLTAATGTNTLDNANLAQTWNWTNGASAVNDLTLANLSAGHTGSVLNVTSNTSGVVAGGVVRFNFTGNHTNMGFRLDDASAAGTAMQINATAQTTGAGLIVNSTNPSQTGKTLNVISNSTNAITNGIAHFNFTGDHTGNGIQVDDVTTAGNAVVINANALTSGSALVINALGRPILASSTATSTFQGGGINLTTAAGNTGCFAINGVCVPTYSQFATSTATNGITFATATNVFTLGGTFNQNTSINLAGFTLDMFGTLNTNIFTATTSAVLASTTAYGRFIVGNIIATSTIASSTFASALGVGTTTPGYRFAIVGTTSATTTNYVASILGNVNTPIGGASSSVMSITNNNVTPGSGANVLRLNIGQSAAGACVIGTTCQRFIEFFAGVTSGDTGGTGIGRINRLAGGNGVTYGTGGADFAEYMIINSASTDGDLIGISGANKRLAQAGDPLVGVVSPSSGFLGNTNIEGTTNAAVVGFTGVVTTKVNASNGAIAAGDSITSSAIAGEGMKQTVQGYSIGRALAAFAGPGSGTIDVLVSPTFTDPTLVAQSTSTPVSGFWQRVVTTGVLSPATASDSLIVASTTSYGQFLTGRIIATSTTASSTFANGINLSAGCFAISNVCLTTASQFSTSTATNGLTFATSSNVFTLGGTLNQNTSVNLAGFNFTLFGGNSFFSTLFASTTNASTTNTGTLTTTVQTTLASTTAYGRFLTSNIISTSTTATSTFAAAITVGAGQGTSTFAGTIGITGAGTSTFAGGVNLSAGCFAISNVCLGAVTGGTAGMLTSWSSASGLTATSGPTAGWFTATSTTGTSTFAGAVGIGTTSPYAKLSVVGDVLAASSDGNIRVGGGTFPNRISSTDAGGISMFDGGTTTKRGLFTELDGALMSYGINVSQIGDRDTNQIGAIFRMDTRANTPYFSVKRQTPGGSTEFSDLQISRTGEVGFGAFASDSNNFPGTMSIRPTSTTAIALHLQATSSLQTADLFRIASSTGTTMFSVSALGVASTTGFIGAGLTDCDTANQKLGWDSATGQFTCITNFPDTGVFSTSSAAGVVVPTNAQTNLFSGGTFPNFTPSTNVNTLLIVANATGTADDATDSYVQLSVRRAIGVDPTCSDTMVGMFTGSFTTNGGELWGASGSFLDNPASTSDVRYTVCQEIVGPGGADQSFNSVTISIIQLGADLAENYYTTDTSIEAGDVVAISGSFLAGVSKTTMAYEQSAMGIISTAPGKLLDDHSGISFGRPVPVALAGRVPVKVTTDNGAIKAGDYLTPSNIFGVAMKATKAGNVIGQALTSYSGTGVGSVIVFIKNSYYAGEVDNSIFSVGSTTTASTSLNVLSLLFGGSEAEQATSTNTSSILTERIVSNQVYAKDLIVDNITAKTIIAENIISPEILHLASTTDDLLARVTILEAKVEVLASSTAAVAGATTTVDLDDLTFTEQLFAKLNTWFADVANNITEFIAGTIRAKDKICVGETCVTEDDLKQLLLNKTATTTATSTEDVEVSDLDGNVDDELATPDSELPETVANEEQEQATSTDVAVDPEPEVIPEAEPVVDQASVAEPIVEEVLIEEVVEPVVEEPVP